MAKKSKETTPLKAGEFSYGKVDALPAAFYPKDAKVKISLYLDGDLLLQIKEDAKRGKRKYQSMINEALRERFMGEATPELRELLARVEANNEKIRNMESRMSIFESLAARLLGKKPNAS